MLVVVHVGVALVVPRQLLDASIAVALAWGLAATAVVVAAAFGVSRSASLSVRT